MLKGLSHVCFVVRDIERSVAFYTDTLGARHAFDFTREDGTRSGAYLHLGARTFIEVFEGKPGEGEGPFRHICLEVESMERAVSELRARGAEVSDPKTGADGNPQVMFRIVRDQADPKVFRQIYEKMIAEDIPLAYCFVNAYRFDKQNQLGDWDVWCMSRQQTR